VMMDGDGNDLKTSCGDRGADGIRVMGTVVQFSGQNMLYVCGDFLGLHLMIPLLLFSSE